MNIFRLKKKKKFLTTSDPPTGHPKFFTKNRKFSKFLKFFKKSKFCRKFNYLVQKRCHFTDLTYIDTMTSNLDQTDTSVKSCNKNIFDHQYQNVKFSRWAPQLAKWPVSYFCFAMSPNLFLNIFQIKNSERSFDLIWPPQRPFKIFMKNEKFSKFSKISKFHNFIGNSFF